MGTYGVWEPSGSRHGPLPAWEPTVPGATPSLLLFRGTASPAPSGSPPCYGALRALLVAFVGYRYICNWL